MEEVEEVGHSVGLRVGDLEREGLLVKVGDAVYEFVTEGETLAEEDGDDLVLVLEECVGEREGVGLRVNEGDAEKVLVTEGEMEIDGEGEVFELALGLRDPVRVADGERDKLGEVDRVRDIELVEHRVTVRVGGG